ncbi:MAG: hypothetical protein J0M10_02570 [Chitinophagales bacterium]|nr:hypothetical protein [Chitinophagales bacterium]
MKNIVNNNRVFVIALLAVLTTAFAPAANAADRKPALPAEVKFVGKVQNNPVFELTVNGSGLQEDYVVNVKDEYGNTLHVENIKADGFTKKFMLTLEESSDYSIQFVISSKTTKKSVQYTINNSTRNIEEVTVSKL